MYGTSHSHHWYDFCDDFIGYIASIGGTYAPKDNGRSSKSKKTSSYVPPVTGVE